MEQSLYHYVTDAVKVWSGFISACLWLLLMNDWMNFLLTLRHAKQPIRECRKAACVCVCVFVWLRVLLTTEGQVVLTLNTDSLMSVLLSAEAAGWTCASWLSLTWSETESVGDADSDRSDDAQEFCLWSFCRCIAFWSICFPEGVSSFSKSSEVAHIMMSEWRHGVACCQQEEARWWIT